MRVMRRQASLRSDPSLCPTGLRVPAQFMLHLHLQAVDEVRVYRDSKTIVDQPLTAPPAEVRRFERGLAGYVIIPRGAGAHSGAGLRYCDLRCTLQGSGL